MAVKPYTYGRWNFNAFFNFWPTVRSSPGYDVPVCRLFVTHVLWLNGMFYQKIVWTSKGLSDGYHVVPSRTPYNSKRGYTDCISNTCMRIVTKPLQLATWILLTAYRNLSMPYTTVPSPTPIRTQIPHSHLLASDTGVRSAFLNDSWTFCFRKCI